MTLVKISALVFALILCKTLICDAALDGATPEVDEWMKQYTDVFASMLDMPRLTSDEILRRLEFLHNTKEDVWDNEWIKKHMTSAVDLWYSAITDKNISHCNVDYFNHINNQLQNIIAMRSPPTRNNDELFNLFYSNGRNLCRQPLVESVNALLSPETVGDLKEIDVAYDQWVKRNLTCKKLAKRTFRQLKIKESPIKDEIVAEWNRDMHSCRKVQQVTNSSDHRDIYNLLQHHALAQPSGSDQMQETINFVFHVGSVCNQLDLMVPDMANDYDEPSMKGRIRQMFIGH